MLNMPRPASHRTVLIALLSASVLPISGCATQTLTSGAALSTAGQSAATQMSQSVAISGATLQQTRVALAFMDGYYGKPGASSAVLANITTLQKNLTMYSNVLNDLGSSYDALGSLSGYNGASNFDSSVQSLSTNVNAFVVATGSTSGPVPAAATTLIGEVGGQVVSSVQAHEVKLAAGHLDIVVGHLVQMLQDDNVKSKIVPTDQAMLDEMHQAASLLYSSKLYSYSPLVLQIGSPFGLQPISDVNGALKSSPDGGAAIIRGFSNVNSVLADAQVAAVGDTYDKSLKLLMALRPLNQQLQSSGHLDSAALNEILAQIESTAAALKAATPPPPATQQ